MRIGDDGERKGGVRYTRYGRSGLAVEWVLVRVYSHQVGSTAITQRAEIRSMSDYRLAGATDRDVRLSDLVHSLPSDRKGA